MEIVWQDLPEKKSCFTVRNAMMMDLSKKRIVQYYSANTKIAVVQKCVISEGTFYRTEGAKRKGLDWAFKASAFGLPDEKAPSAPKHTSDLKPVSRLKKPVVKQTASQKAPSSKGGETRPSAPWWRKLFRRKNG